jgi:hypothetical protein
MAAERSRPGSHSVRKGKAVGPDYPEARYRNPFDDERDHYTGGEGEKTLYSPVNTPSGIPSELHHGYNDYWEKGK